MKKISPIDEVKMSPSTFSAAMEKGENVGVQVGFEFEVCVPATRSDTGDENKRQLLAAFENDYISFFYIFAVDTGYDYDLVIPPPIMDKYLKIKSGSSAKYSSFNEVYELAATGGSKKVRYSTLLEYMFPAVSHDTIESVLEKYFEILDSNAFFTTLNDHFDFGELNNETLQYNSAAKMIKSEVEQSMNAEVIVFTQYHQKKKNTTSWYIEPDNSLDPNAGDAALEIVSPPLPAQQAIETVKNFYAMAKSLNLYTGKNNNTGLHINVSIPKTLDVLKLAVLLGDEYVLKYFDREDNEYARSVIAKLQNYDSSPLKRKMSRRKSKILPGKTLGKTEIQSKILNELIKDASRSHFASINNNGKYISFRHAGGDYLNDYSGVINIIGRFVQAMIIASDPEAHRREYLKKLIKVFGSPEGSQTSQRQQSIEEMRKLIQTIKSRGLPVLQFDIGEFQADTVRNYLLMRATNSQTLGPLLSSKFSFDNIVEGEKTSAATKKQLKAKAKENYYVRVPIESFRTVLVFPKIGNTLYDLYKLADNSNVITKPLYGTISGAIKVSLKFLPYSDPRVQKLCSNLISGIKTQPTITESQEAPIYYFSYGMLTDPKYMYNSKLIGVAELKNFVYKIHGFANVEPETGNSVYGVLWQINREVLGHLDKIEGYPTLYDRRTYPVYLNGKKFTAEVYVMTPSTLNKMTGRMPSKEYLKTVSRGYINAGVPTSQLVNAVREVSKNSSNVKTDLPVEEGLKSILTTGALALASPSAGASQTPVPPTAVTTELPAGDQTINAQKLKLITDIQSYVNHKIKFVPEPPGQDEWKLPEKFGDCEDLALLKRKMLIDAGWPEDDIKLVIVYVPAKTKVVQEAHVVLMIKSMDIILEVVWVGTALNPEQRISPPPMNTQTYLTKMKQKLYCDIEDISLGDHHGFASDRCKKQPKKVPPVATVNKDANTSVPPGTKPTETSESKRISKKSCQTNENLGMPFPGTYEQEYNKFKSKGPRKITAMTNEALDSSYDYEGDAQTGKFYFSTEAGINYKVYFEGQDYVEVAFSAQSSRWKDDARPSKTTLTGTGDSRRVLGTVVAIIKEYLHYRSPEVLYFTAEKDEPSRVNLYKALVARVDRAIPEYTNTDSVDLGSGIAFMLKRKS